MFRDESIQPVCRFWNQTKRLQVPWCRICAHHKNAFQFPGVLQTKFHPLFGTDPLKDKRDLEKKSISLHWLFLTKVSVLCAEMKVYIPNDLDICRN